MIERLNEKRRAGSGLSCSYCTGFKTGKFPVPHGHGRVVDGDPQNIVSEDETADENGVVTWLCCQDCWRRGGRWRARMRAALGTPQA